MLHFESHSFVNPYIFILIDFYPVSEWNLANGIYTVKEKIQVPNDDLFIYGYFWGRTLKDRVLLGFNYQEVIEKVLRDYT